LHTRYLYIALSLLGFAAPARAELVFFASGRTLNVRGHRSEGDSLVLALRSGGEVALESSLITRIAPDEAPYPEPAEEVRPTASAPSALQIGLAEAEGVGGKADPPNADAGSDSSATNRGVRLQPHLEAFIDRVSAREGVDARLVRAVIEVESGYRPRARSPRGAMGLMQLMPATARRYKVKNPYDPAANIEGGIKHLKSLLARFPREMALAAYNAGDAAVERFGGIPPYAETRNYVSRILQIVERS
jgi:soluble lytic murein transglycosylase-like protein